MSTNSKLIFILPNLFTATSLFLGVVSVIASAHGQFSKAVWLIAASLIFDGLDGRVARLTNTTSKFGVEFDSLADLVAFGVAPAMLFYFAVCGGINPDIAGGEFGRFGTAIAAIFVVFGGIRLARFNVTTGTYEPNVFIGLPIPSAAMTLAFWVAMSVKYGWDLSWFLAFLTILLSVLMVSNVRFPSFKKLDLSRSAQLKGLTLLIAAVALIYFKPIEFITLSFSAYIIYGIIRGVYNLFFARKIKYKNLVKNRQERDKNAEDNNL